LNNSLINTGPPRLGALKLKLH